MTNGIDRVAREAAIATFLVDRGWDKAERRLLAGDASFRRYDRLTDAAGNRAVLMDAPPPMEDVRPFIAIDRLLYDLGLSVPRIMGEDAANGLLLLEDFGDDTYTRLLARGHDETALYELATDALVALHQRLPQAALAGLRKFDLDSALRQVSLLLDWYWPELRGAPAPADVRAEFDAAWRQVLPRWHRLPETIVLFDFHIDNLLLLPGRAGVQACGLLDFQDALSGPLAFDLVSLLEDVRRNVPMPLMQAMIARYLAANPQLDRDDFMTVYAVSGAQRNTRIAGTFTRLLRRDGKPGYQRYMPRVWELIAHDISHPALAPVAAWYAKYLPPPDRKVFA
ncbi:MAG: aminoglycoside phosphotransferase [Rhodospirillaceae bacterium]|nr:MAG: aminoglycoside phosphotransferase [Rhodospirillaceae bacterium]